MILQLVHVERWLPAYIQEKQNLNQMMRFQFMRLITEFPDSVPDILAFARVRHFKDHVAEFQRIIDGQLHEAFYALEVQLYAELLIEVLLLEMLAKRRQIPYQCHQIVVVQLPVVQRDEQISIQTWLDFFVTVANVVAEHFNVGQQLGIGLQIPVLVQQF